MATENNETDRSYPLSTTAANAPAVGDRQRNESSGKGEPAINSAQPGGNLQDDKSGLLSQNETRAVDSAGTASGLNARSYNSRPKSFSNSNQNQNPNSNAKPRPKPTPQEARQTYFKWLERLEAKALEDQETRVRLESTKELAARLEEANILAVYRLVEIFGYPLVEAMVARALTLHKEAKEKGEAVYTPRENPKATQPEHRLIGTEVATGKGQPRTPGGVFFFIMRRYVTRLRLAWENLIIPWLPELEHKGATTTNAAAPGSATVAETQTEKNEGKQLSKVKEIDTPSNQNPKREVVTKTSSTQLPVPLMKTQATPASVGPASKIPGDIGGVVPSKEGVVKPSRGKVVITGSPKSGSQPKVAPQGLSGVLELLFEIEPGGNPPKGLPVLEKTLVKVWVTDKQYNKIKDTLTPTSRFLIEGEIGAGVNSQDFQPFIRVICTRLTTLELEQEAKQKKAGRRINKDGKGWVVCRGESVIMGGSLSDLSLKVMGFEQIFFINCEQPQKRIYQGTYPNYLVEVTNNGK